MELNEAFRRVVLRHKAVILLFILLGAAVPVGLSSLSDPTYTGTVRLVLNTPDPVDPDASIAIADGAEAVVTSPDKVSAALQEAGVDADPLIFARENVHVRALGTSGVLEVLVTTNDPNTASQMATILADDLIKTRREIGNSLQQFLNGLEDDENRLQTRISQTADVTALADLHARLAAVQEDMRSAAAEIAQQPKAKVINPAEPPAAPDPSGLATEITLGVILGLILGVALAAMLELVRPTLAGAAAVARALGTRVLGTAPRVGDRFAPIDPTDPMVVRLRLAAAAESVTAIEVLAVPSSLSATSLAYRLEEALGAAGPRGRSRRSLTVRAFGLEAVPGLEGPSAAVVVAEPSVSQKDLDAARDLLSLAELPVLGVIVADKPRRRGRKRHEAALKAKPERQKAEPERVVVLPDREPEPRPSNGETDAPAGVPATRPARPSRPVRPVRPPAKNVQRTPRPASPATPTESKASSTSTRVAEESTPHAGATRHDGATADGTWSEATRTDRAPAKPAEPDGAISSAERATADDPGSVPEEAAPAAAGASTGELAFSAPSRPTRSRDPRRRPVRGMSGVRARPTTTAPSPEDPARRASATAEGDTAPTEEGAATTDGSTSPGQSASAEQDVADARGETSDASANPARPARPAPKKRSPRADQGSTPRSPTGGTDDGRSDAAGGRASAR